MPKNGQLISFAFFDRSLKSQIHAQLSSLVQGPRVNFSLDGPNPTVETSKQQVVEAVEKIARPHDIGCEATKQKIHRSLFVSYWTAWNSNFRRSWFDAQFVLESGLPHWQEVGESPYYCPELARTFHENQETIVQQHIPDLLVVVGWDSLSEAARNLVQQETEMYPWAKEVLILEEHKLPAQLEYVVKFPWRAPEVSTPQPFEPELIRA